MQHHSCLIADQQTFHFTVSVNALKKRSPSSSALYTYLYKRFGQRGSFNYVALIFCDGGEKKVVLLGTAADRRAMTSPACCSSQRASRHDISVYSEISGGGGGPVETKGVSLLLVTQ